jgi:hypothetical protein
VLWVDVVFLIPVVLVGKVDLDFEVEMPVLKSPHLVLRLSTKSF